MKLLTACCLLIFLTGCNRTALLDRMAPDDRKAQAIETLEALRKGTGEETFRLLPDGQKNEEAKRTLAILAERMPDRDVTALTFVNYQWQMTNGKKYYNFVFEYDFEGRYLLADITLEKKGDGFLVAGLHVNETTESIVESSKFDFADAGVVHFIFLFATIALPIFSLWTLIICIKTKGLRRKWLWCVFIVIGFISFRLNWSTGEVAWQLISFQLFSSSATSSGVYGPWILGFSIPVGAVVFWGKRKKLKAQPAAAINS